MPNVPIPQPYAWVPKALKGCYQTALAMLVPFRILEGIINIVSGCIIIGALLGAYGLYSGAIKLPHNFIQSHMEQAYQMIDPDMPHPKN